LSLSEKKVAVEINEEVVPRDNYVKKILSSKDRVEIVHFIGGG
jgi:sulfur carrier protein